MRCIQYNGKQYLYFIKPRYRAELEDSAWRDGGQSLPTYLFFAVLYRSSVEEVKPLEDSVSEAACIRQDLACGVEAYKVSESICVGATHVLIVVMLPAKLLCNTSSLWIFYLIYL